MPTTSRYVILRALFYRIVLHNILSKEEQGSLFFYLQDNMTAASMCALKQSQLV